MTAYKGVIVVDSKGSPLWSTAMSHSLKNNVEVVAAIDYATTRKLVQTIVFGKPDFVIFSWRGAIDAVFQSHYSREKLLELDPWIFLLIPDYLGVNRFSSKEQQRIDMCDGILVTSTQLMQEYQNLYEVKEIQLLHDLPDLDLIKVVREKNLTRIKNRVIWVGNSKWGERAGYQDHKGLKRFVLPTEEILDSRHKGVSFKLIDSAHEKLPYVHVLEEIAASECLIVTSESEGTSLPILEAVAVGTPVVCFDVGIASELFTKGLKSQIVQKNLDLLASKIEYTLANFEKLSSACQSSFEEYIFKVGNDLERLRFSPDKDGTWRIKKSSYKPIDSLKWIYRWLNR